MKLNVGLIGKGKWGKKIKVKLNNLAYLKFVNGKKSNYLKSIKRKQIDWIFIATPNHTHYKIVKDCIKNKLNVFCEKPLSESPIEVKKLINLAKKKKVKLFISDLYDFYTKKINIIKNENFIYRSKFVKKSDKEFFYRFMYHDISILYNVLKKNKLLKCFLEKNNKKKMFRISILLKNKKSLVFSYNLADVKKKHFINNLQIKSKKDELSYMIKKVLNNGVDFKYNNNKGLFIVETIKKIKRSLKYVV